MLVSTAITRPDPCKQGRAPGHMTHDETPVAGRAFEAGPPQFKRRAMLCLGKDVMKTAFHQGSQSDVFACCQPAHFA